MLRLDARTLRVALAVTLAALTFGLTGCEEAFDGPSIARFAVAPDSVSSSGQCGMGDQYFEAEAVISGADSQLADGQLLLLDTPDGDRRAAATVDTVETAENYQFDYIDNYTATTDDSALIFRQIQQSWCQNLQPGTYDIEVTAFLEDGSEISRTFFDELSVSQ